MAPCGQTALILESEVLLSTAADAEESAKAVILLYKNYVKAVINQCVLAAKNPLPYSDGLGDISNSCVNCVQKD